jgi:ariadne-1
MDYSDDEEEEYEYSDADEEDLEFGEVGIKNTEEYLIMDRDAIVKQQQMQIASISNLLDLEPQQARFVLMHFRWSTEKVQTAFFDHGKEMLLQTSGVFVGSEAGSSGTDCSEQGDGSIITCQMCIDELPRSECEAMACGHLFCNNCWSRYLQIQIDEGQSCHIRCPAISPKQCIVMCDEAKVTKLVDGPTQTKFTFALMNNFIDNNKLTKWCPSPDCGRAIKCDDMNRPIEVR